MNRAPASEIRECAVSHQGMTSMRQDGFGKVIEGITTINEINRATADL
jgi:type II secretory ATPase GspE/PulE/Tfp pilus assembly ATPase PilB-like protein